MESSRPVKRQRTELAAAEAQADSSVIMSTDPTGEAPPQQTVSAATDSAPEPQARYADAAQAYTSDAVPSKPSDATPLPVQKN